MCPFRACYRAGVQHRRRGWRDCRGRGDGVRGAGAAGRCHARAAPRRYGGRATAPTGQRQGTIILCDLISQCSTFNYTSYQEIMFEIA